MLAVLSSITGLLVQRNAASQASESVVDAVSDLLLASIVVLAVLLLARVSKSATAGDPAFRGASAARNCRLADWCRHHLHAVGKGLSQTPRFGAFGTCSLLQFSESVVVVVLLPPPLHAHRRVTLRPNLCPGL